MEHHYDFYDTIVYYKANMGIVSNHLIEYDVELKII